MSDPERRQESERKSADDAQPAPALPAIADEATAKPEAEQDEPTKVLPFALSEPPTTIYRGTGRNAIDEVTAELDPIARLNALTEDWLDHRDTVPVPPEHAADAPEQQPPVETSASAVETPAPAVETSPPAVETSTPSEPASATEVAAGAAPIALGPAETSASDPDVEIRSSDAGEEAAAATSEPPVVAPAATVNTPNRSARPAETRPRRSEIVAEQAAPPAAQGSRAWVALLVLGGVLGIWALARRGDTEAPATHDEMATTPTVEPAAEAPAVVEQPAAPVAAMEQPAAPVAAPEPAPEPSAAPPALASEKPPSNEPAPKAPAAADPGGAPSGEISKDGTGAEPVRLTAYKAVAQAAQTAKNCRQRGDAPGRLRAYVTFGPSGRVEQTQVQGQLVNPMTRDCIVSRFAGLTVPAFSGEPLTVGADVRIY